MKLPRLITLGLLTLAAPVILQAGDNAAATPDVILNPALSYTRPAFNSPASITPGTRATILDLRYFPADAKQADAWLAAASDRATPAHPCFLLISPETSPALLKALGTGIPGVITIGRAAPGTHPDIAVDTSAASDRAAWTAGAQLDALGLEKLITPAIDKPRYDEAALAKEHAADLAGTADTDSSADNSTPDAPSAPAPTAKPKSMPLIDAVLLRAVQIDRGLLALKKV